GLRVITVHSRGEMRLWDDKLHALIVDLGGHETIITTAKFSADGRRLLSASRDETTRLWDVETGKEIAVLKGHSDVIADAIFSPDGSRLLTISMDQTARLWDANSGAEISILKLNGEATSSAFSPDGAMITVAQSNLRVSTIFVSDVASKKLLTALEVR